MLLPQLVVSGIATGMLYALIALSMTVVYRATTVVNFGAVLGGFSLSCGGILNRITASWSALQLTQVMV